MAEIRVGDGAGNRKARRKARSSASGVGRKGKKVGAGARAGDSGKELLIERMEGSAKAAEAEEKGRGNGLQRLERAADRRLRDASSTLADLLLEKAKEGKVESTRLLVALAERSEKRKPDEKKEKKREGPSWAELLVSEPEWTEEDEEASKPKVGDVWVGDGWKNPETGEITRDFGR